MHVCVWGGGGDVVWRGEILPLHNVCGRGCMLEVGCIRVSDRVGVGERGRGRGEVGSINVPQPLYKTYGIKGLFVMVCVLHAVSSRKKNSDY